MATNEKKKNVQALNEEDLSQVTGGKINNDKIIAIRHF